MKEDEKCVVLLVEKIQRVRSSRQILPGAFEVLSRISKPVPELSVKCGHAEVRAPTVFQV
jgi:hypothetical protein